MIIFYFRLFIIYIFILFAGFVYINVWAGHSYASDGAL